MEKNTNNLLDNCIRNDLKLIEKNLEIMLLVWTALFSMGLSWGGLLLAVPALIAVMACLYNIFRKLFSTSIYGTESTLYRALPVPVSTLVLSKIFTGGLVFAGLGIIYYVCLVFRALVFKDGFQDVVLVFEGWIRGFAELGVDTGMVPLAAALDFLNMAIRCFSLSAMILVGTTLYHSLPSEGKIRYVQNTMLYVGMTLLVTYVLLGELPESMEWMESAFLRVVFNLALSLAILAAGYKTSVYLMEKKDGGVK